MNTEEESVMCPLGANGGACPGDSCAWWYEGEYTGCCAMAHLAENTEGLADSTNAIAGLSAILAKRFC